MGAPSIAAPFGTIDVVIGDVTHEVALPCSGEMRNEGDGWTMDDPFGTWHLVLGDRLVPEWKHQPNAWVQRTTRINALRSDVLSYLDALALSMPTAAALAERIRKESW